MKFTKFGKALLLSALSFGVLGVTSCVQSYTVGFLYVTSTATAQASGNGIISGFKIDHNTGQLRTINGLPISSGGANPVRAVLIQASRFLYVLNRGVTASGGADCTSADPCLNSNITQFAVGANGIITPQETFFSQGTNPFRIIADSGGNYLLVLDHDSPSNGSNPNCGSALGNNLLACGDITVFQVNPTTGRLSVVTNTQVTSQNCPNNLLTCPLPYFPVPANPVDFMLTAINVLTLSGSPNTSYPYTGGNAVFPYTYNSGQLTVSQNSSQPINDGSPLVGSIPAGVPVGTGILSAGGFVYVLDNKAVLVNGSVVANSQILPFSVSAGGALQAQTGGAVPDDPTQENPIYAITESKNKWLYLANQGTGSTGSGITGYVIDPSTHQLTEMPGLPFVTGSGPQCIVEDPSDQFIYTANFNDSTVTGQSIDQSSGQLRPLVRGSSFTVTGPATYCLVNSRTN